MLSSAHLLDEGFLEQNRGRENFGVSAVPAVANSPNQGL
jgi:hypothetical protein